MLLEVWQHAFMQHAGTEAQRIAHSLLVPHPMQYFTETVAAKIPGRAGSSRIPCSSRVVRDTLMPIQFLHQDDVGRAFLLCTVGTGLTGMYNMTGDGELSGAQLLRELGWRPRYSRREALRDTLEGCSAQRGES
jgi:hypothetical protein